MTEDRTWTDLTAAAECLVELAEGNAELAAIRARLLDLAGEAEAHA